MHESPIIRVFQKDIIFVKSEAQIGRGGKGLFLPWKLHCLRKEKQHLRLGWCDHLHCLRPPTQCQWCGQVAIPGFWGPRSQQELPTGIWEWTWVDTFPMIQKRVCVCQRNISVWLLLWCDLRVFYWFRKTRNTLTLGIGFGQSNIFSVYFFFS